jgi:hypothetical protein
MFGDLTSGKQGLMVKNAVMPYGRQWGSGIINFLHGNCTTRIIIYVL